MTIYVSPNRANLTFTVIKVKKQRQLAQLTWLVKLIEEKGKETPKTIIFCNTMVEIATVLNFLMNQLGNQAYDNPDSKSSESCLVGVYHSHSWESTKNMVIASFKGNGIIRVVIATTALCMGVNFPDVRYIINWGPARTILDQHQQAGRAGRDSVTSHVIVLYHGQQAGPCEQAVKDFVRSEGCLRVAAYKSLDDNIKSSSPQHDCCSYCKSTCVCKGGMCDAPLLAFEKIYEEETHPANVIYRAVTPEDRLDLKNALVEVMNDIQAVSMSLDDTARHGFSLQLVEDIVARCNRIFGIDDITMNFPVYSLSNAQRIIEVIQEIFLDIPNFDETANILDKENIIDSSYNWWLYEENLTFGNRSDDSE